MSGNVIIHIGPPKTATTSLQIAFDAVVHDKFFYAGTFQPRDKNKDSICASLYRACAKGLEHQNADTEIRRQIMAVRDSGKTILFSEEMFLVEQKHASIKKKLNNLQKLLSGIDCRVVMTVRRPAAVLPSYYQEIFKSLPLKLQRDFPAFCSDIRASCYDFTYLCKSLNDAGFKDVRLVEFDYLVSGHVDLGRFAGIKELDGISLDVSHQNAGRTGSVETERILPKVSLRSLGRVTLLGRFFYLIKLRHWPGYKSAIEFLDRVTFLPSKTRKLEVPPDILRRLDASYDFAIRRHGFLEEGTQRGTE